MPLIELLLLVECVGKGVFAVGTSVPLSTAFCSECFLLSHICWGTGTCLTLRVLPPMALRPTQEIALKGLRGGDGQDSVPSNSPASSSSAWHDFPASNKRPEGDGDNWGEGFQNQTLCDSDTSQEDQLRPGGGDTESCSREPVVRLHIDPAADPGVFAKVDFWSIHTCMHACIYLCKKMHFLGAFGVVE